MAEISEKYGLGLTTKTNWTHWEMPKQADLERYLNNIRVIRRASGLRNLPSVPDSMQKFNYAMANDIEQILLDVNALNAASLRTGDVYSGEV